MQGVGTLPHRQVPAVQRGLLTGFDTTISPDEEREVRAALKSTQNEPILSRQVLGAGLNEFNVTLKEKMSILIIKTNCCQRGEMMPVMGGQRGAGCRVQVG